MIRMGVGCLAAGALVPMLSFVIPQFREAMTQLIRSLYIFLLLLFESIIFKCRRVGCQLIIRAGLLCVTVFTTVTVSVST